MKKEKCVFCSLSGIESAAAHEVVIAAGSMLYGAGADDTVACLCDECFVQIGDEPETRADLKNVIQNGAHITPDSWGDAYIITDDTLASESMLMCGFTHDDGTAFTADEFAADIKSDTYTICEYRGKFYVMEDAGTCKNEPMYRLCGNPAEITDGLLQMFGVWKNFDYVAL